MRPIILVALILFFSQPSSKAQQRLLCLSWNIESGDNDRDTIAKRLSDFEGYDIIGLSEVRAGNAALYTDALEKGEGANGSASPEFRYSLGTTGDSDRLMIVWDNKRMEKIGEAVELNSLNEGNHRAPLYCKFRLRDTNIEFIYMVNHLARGNGNLRNGQAEGLVEWVQNQDVPVIAVGDYNYDFSIDSGEGNQGYDNMIEGSHWRWLRPDRLHRTQMSAKYYSVLDFVFVGNMTDNWSGTSKILTHHPSEDDEFESDHRPIEACFHVSAN